MTLGDFVTIAGFICVIILMQIPSSGFQRAGLIILFIFLIFLLNKQNENKKNSNNDDHFKSAKGS